MSNHMNNRYCADREAIAAMKRDGLGWGHDLDCGCFRADIQPPKRRPLIDIFNPFKGRN